MKYGRFTSMYPDSKKIVLVVDDDPDNLDLIQEQVSLLIDCSIITASDGNTALALAKEFRPRLILLDIWLIGLDGFQVVQQLKLDSRTQSTVGSKIYPLFSKAVPCQANP